VTVQNGLANPGGSLFVGNAGALSVGGGWTNAGGLFLQSGSVAGGSLCNQSLIEGVGAVSAPLVNQNGGTVRASGGALALNGTTIQNQPGGVLEAIAGSTLRINRSFANQGVVNNRGGDIDLGSNTLTNTGTLTGYGGFKAAQIINQTRAQFSGGQADIYSTYLNSAGATTTVLHATANFFGAFTNLSGAYFKNTGSDVTFFGSFYNNGTFTSDPAVNTFSAGLTLGLTGILTGGDGDVFVINGDLSSANPNGLQLAGAKVVFNAGAHTFTLAGPTSLATLELSDGANVSLIGADLYIGLLNGETNQFTTAQTIYYDPAQNPLLAGQTYTLNGGGSLSPVPEPSSALLVLLGVAALVSSAVRKRVFLPRGGGAPRLQF
jgi:hypothetical protein